MKTRIHFAFSVPYRCLAVLLIGLLSNYAHGAIELPRLVSDGMVLQRGIEINLWGRATPSSSVELQFRGQTFRASVGAKGDWSVLLPQQEAGGPYQLKIKNGEETTEVHDILIGDVWLCSGQSNMELNMERASPLYEDVIARASHPNFRYFEVPKRYNFQEDEHDLPGGYWKTLSPENVRSVSALCYFLGVNLANSQRVPIGIINASLGGSPAEAWISPEALRAFPESYAEAVRFRNDLLIDSIQSAERLQSQEWQVQATNADQGHSSVGLSWSQPDCNIEDWASIHLPGDWSASPIAGQPGVIWVRRSFQVPDHWSDQAAYLQLGRLVDADSVFINGQFVGRTTYQYPPRRYQVPKGVLKSGQNTIVVRLVTNSGRPEFVTDKLYQISSQGETIGLYGLWHYRQGVVMPPAPSTTFIRWKPTGLFRAMIHPLLRYRIKGIVWYQGESNVGRAETYEALMKTLIQDWRERWGQGNLPFLVAQLPNFQNPALEPIESKWAELRDAQRRLQRIPNTKIAVTIDLGEWNDIHPLNKKAVADRLAMVARQAVYEEEMVASGPIYERQEVEGNSIRLFFSGVGSGLVAAKGGPLQHFAIAGEDRKFVWAEARIEGHTIVVQSDLVNAPKYVRYAWSDNPLWANLYNQEGLPASPFSTEE